MKYLPIHPALVLLAALIACGLVESLPAADRKHRGAAITNATSGGMPIARKQKIGRTFIYTAKAKRGYCFAVKGEKIAYMSKERAKQLGARAFYMSHEARAFAKFNKSK